MDLSVIVVNYNVRRFLNNALSSIRRAMEGLEGEVIVVDNASDDGSVEMIRSDFPDVHLIVNRENVGFSRANNEALRRARGRYLLLLNPDTIVQEDTFHVMMDFFERHPDAGLAGCKILNPDGSLQLACRRSFPTPWVAFTKIFGLSGLFPHSRLFGRYNLTFRDPEQTYTVDAVSGSFMMIRRDVYEKIGGLDESFFMYGEDLDWCYRVSTAGHNVYYVHDTKIVHFKGESTRRSDIDELRLFYRAMQLFVEKHFNRSGFVKLVLNLGILFRGTIASAGRAARPLMLAAVDYVLVALSLVLGELLYFGTLFHFPRYAYPIVWIVPALTIATVMALGGGYTVNRYSSSRAAISVITGYVIISSIVFFVKDFAFSRAVVLISGFLSFLLLPGWRVMVRVAGKGGSREGRKTLFGRRTVIVGTGSSAQEVLKKLRARVDDGYDVLGFVDLTRKHVGEKLSGLDILGSIDNVGKVIEEHRVGEVIFSTDGLAYTDILSVIARSKSGSVNFRLVPSTLEAIIGKTRIDELDTLPLVEIEYNLHKTSHRVVKRAFDFLMASVLLVGVYPFVRIRESLRRHGAPGPLARMILSLPRVLSGKLSFVGLPQENVTKNGAAGQFLGRPGLTGLVQINQREDLEPDEAERYRLYYAKNQSLMLDLEIIAKSILLMFQTGRRSHG